MNDLRSPLHRIAPFTAVILVALAMAGCSKKITAVDPDYTAPEGRREAGAQQIVYPDRPTTVYLLKIAPSNCEECTDEQVSVDEVYPAGPGVINGMIFDGTPASSYQIMRRELNGGYAPLYDYALNPVQRLTPSGWKLFTWQDVNPSGFDPPTYLGRGIVSGVVTRTTPLTNVGSGQAVDVEEIFLATDSLRAFTYSPVTSAVGYVLQVYAPRGAYATAFIYNAAPAPFAREDHRDYLVAWLPATQGIVDGSKVDVLTRLAYIPGARYLVRMSAVDSLGRLVGFSYGQPFAVNGPDEGYYRVFRGGAILAAAATRPATGPALARPTFSMMAAPPRHAREISPSRVKIRFEGH